MPTKSQTIIHEIITADFGCQHCSQNAECPVFQMKTTPHGQPRKNLPCLAYTYIRVANLLLNKLANIPWNDATDAIVEHHIQTTKQK